MDTEYSDQYDESSGYGDGSSWSDSSGYGDGSSWNDSSGYEESSGYGDGSTYQDPSAYGEPVVGGWGQTYGDVPADGSEQSVWDQVTDWVEDLVTPSDDSSESSGGIADAISDIWLPIEESIRERQERESAHLASFRGRLNSAIQATELLHRDSTFEEVLSASGLITTAANTASIAADELGRDTREGGEYERYHNELAYAASQLEAIALTNSPNEYEYSTQSVLYRLRNVGADSESLY